MSYRIPNMVACADQLLRLQSCRNHKQCTDLYTQWLECMAKTTKNPVFLIQLQRRPLSRPLSRPQPQPAEPQ